MWSARIIVGLWCRGAATRAAHYRLASWISCGVAVSGFYGEHVLPHLINLSMRNRVLRPLRERLIAQAKGRVLELGVGSGLNFAFYGPGVVEVVGVEPSLRLAEMARRAAASMRVSFCVLQESAESLPVEDGTFDTVVTTWTLCSIPGVDQALKEIRRVLTPSGQLLFAEHGLAPEESVRRWQDRLTPVWKKVAGGCHLNRPIPTLVESAGFDIRHLETGYVRGPRPLTFMYEGRAAPST
jgi:SAM-dependent methyltransferase